MSTSQQPPMSRREARLAAQQAAASSLESLIEPGSDDRPADGVGPEHGGSGRLDAASVGSAPVGSAPLGSASAASAPAPSTPAPPSAPAPAEGRFRARDFRPPAERERPVTSPPSFAAVQPDDAPLEYRTAARSPSAVSASAASAPAFSAPAFSAPAPSAPEPAVWMPVLPTAPAATAPVSAAQPSREEPVREQPSREEPGQHEPLQHDEGRDAAVPAAEPAVDERTMSRRELRARRAAAEPAVDEEPAGAEAPDADAHAAPAPNPVVAPPLSLVEPPAVLPGESAQPQPSTATGSHWSVGAQAADDDPFENTFSRQVGSAAASTNVLVLPEMPMAGLTGPVPGTGEIIITGMIDVPKSISSTGSMSAVHESPDIDDLFEAGEREVPSTESTPVSAINAVSGHTATRAVMGGRKPRGNTVTTALVASTVVMAVAAVTIFVVAAANGLF
ncbi:hypothetical protein OVN18_00850 [Microcella daejeonensis]|uniref:Uncharacterized protein n=1 Tax=Microcella daejeonensis TaxID=2994971 RepID=A0A9E8S8H5_9MICO|nr:hypothetical protein [Microcella daejeonensis]WAB81605.1 hypothetical protein OVN18_00850 [Microcella daejeonensis]